MGMRGMARLAVRDSVARETRRVVTRCRDRAVLGEEALGVRHLDAVTRIAELVAVVAFQTRVVLRKSVRAVPRGSRRCGKDRLVDGVQ